MRLKHLFKPFRGRRRPRAAFDNPYVVLGLGNPGGRYRNTRHNVGFWCIDELASRSGLKPGRGNPHALLAEGFIEGRPVVLAKPRVFVNQSGQAARYLLRRYNVRPDALIVLVDDMNLPPGRVRVRRQGSAGGHNGLKSIIAEIGSSQFPRVRMGIGRPENGGDEVAHVLGTMRPEERALVAEAVRRAADGVEMILRDGIARAMNELN